MKYIFFCKSSTDNTGCLLKERMRAKNCIFQETCRPIKLKTDIQHCQHFFIYLSFSQKLQNTVILGVPFLC